MKPKTDKNGVRRAVFSAADERLWHRTLDSLVEIQLIEKGNMHRSRGCPVYQIACTVQLAMEEILQMRAPTPKPTDEAPDTPPDEETDGD